MISSAYANRYCHLLPSADRRPADATPAPSRGTAITPIAPPAPPEVRRPAPEPTAAWNGEGEAPPAPTEPSGGKRPTGAQGLFARYRKPIGAGLAVAAAAGLAVAFWPRKRPATPAALPAGTARPR